MYALQQPNPVKMAEAEYLAFADSQAEKYEYSQGYVYAMTGGSFKHSAITGNVITHLNNLLDDTDCLATSSDMCIFISTKTAYRYPDVSVICGEPDYVENRTDIVTNPVLLVEVLSPSTAPTDRSQKVKEYTEIDSLQAYLLVAQDEVNVGYHLRHEFGLWQFNSVADLESEIHIPSLGISMAMSRIYRKIWE